MGNEAHLILAMWPCYLDGAWTGAQIDLKDKTECEGFCLWPWGPNLLWWQNFHDLVTFSCWSKAPAYTFCSNPVSWWLGEKSYRLGNTGRMWRMVWSYLWTKIIQSAWKMAEARQNSMESHNISMGDFEGLWHLSIQGLQWGNLVLWRWLKQVSGDL